VSGGGVLALRTLGEPAGDGRSPGLRWTALQRLDVAQPQGLEIRKVEAAHGDGDVSKRVGAFVPIVARVGQRSCADGVEHDHAGTRHVAILGRSWRPSWD